MNDQQVNQCVGSDKFSVDMLCAHTGQSQIFQRTGTSHPLCVLAGSAGLAGRIHRHTVFKAFQSKENHPFSTAVKLIYPSSSPITFVSASAVRPFFHGNLITSTWIFLFFCEILVIGLASKRYYSPLVFTKLLSCKCPWFFLLFLTFPSNSTWV